ncbi:MAG: peptidylprolyl isomerase [Planctomycetota bacterium]
MLKTRFRLVALALIVLGGNSLAQKSLQDAFLQGSAVPAGAVAVVNGSALSIAEYSQSIYERFVGHKQGIEALDDLIDRRIISAQMAKRGLSVSDTELNAHYSDLDKRYRQQSKGQMGLDKVIAQKGISKGVFMSRLRLQLSLKRMTAQDFKRKDVSPADQQQWLRSKKLDARLEQDPKKLPANAASRVYDRYITYEDFARNVSVLLPERDVVDLIRTRLETRLALDLAKKQGIIISEADRKAQFKTIKTNFESNPKFKGMDFEDLIKQRTGMSMEAYRRGPGFEREVALSLLGLHYVPDDQTAATYDKYKDHFGPLQDVRHIFIRGSKNAGSNQNVRSLTKAKEHADAVYGRIKKGAKFQDLVKLMSDDANTKFQGGRLDIFTPASARNFPALEKLLKTMQIGDIKGPIASPRGYHIIKLENVAPAPALTPAIVADLRKRVAFEKFREAWITSKPTRGINLRRFLGKGE